MSGAVVEARFRGAVTGDEEAEFAEGILRNVEGGAALSLAER